MNPLHGGLLEAGIEEAFEVTDGKVVDPEWKGLNALATLSLAISIKRIADMAEEDRLPVNSLAPDMEHDPLMMIARAMEEISRPTLPQEGPMVEISRREMEALETIAKRLDHLTDYFDPDKAQLRVGANCDVRQVG